MSTTNFSYRWSKEWLEKRLKGVEAAEPLFLTLLGMARSVRDVRRLHQLLPTDCQLSRDDLIALEEFWKDHFHYDANKQASPNIDSDVAFCIFDRLIPPYRLRAYYRRVIEQDRPNIANPGSSSQIYKYQRILSNPERICRGYTHFVAVMQLGVGLECGAYVSETRDKVIIFFSLWEGKLDECLTHSIIQLPVYSLINQGRSASSVNGTEINLAYLFNPVDILPHLDQLDHTKDHSDDYVAKESFCPFLLKKLQTMGLPIIRLDPIE